MLSKAEVSSIVEPLEKRFWERVKIDRTVLQNLGFSYLEIEKWRRRVYDSLASELKSMKNVEA